MDPNQLAEILNSLPQNLQPDDLPEPPLYTLIGAATPIALPRTLTLAEWLEKYDGPTEIIDDAPPRK